MAVTPEAERTRDRVTWIVSAVLGNEEAMEDVRNFVREAGGNKEDIIVAYAAVITAKIELLIP